MKRLIWIASEKREKLFDEVWNAADIISRFYNIEHIPNLMSFVTRSKALADQEYFVVDLTEATYDDEQIIEAVRMLKQLSAARPIFIAPACEDADILYGLLEGEGVTNLVKEKPDSDLEDEMRMCISTDGRSFASRVTALQDNFAAQAMAIVRPITIPDGVQISIAVAGTMARVGTTTQSTTIYRYLKKLGFKPLLIDATRNIYEAVQLVYADRIENRGLFFTLDDMALSDEDVPDEMFNARITDIGVLAEDNITQFQSADISVLVSGVKPWELAHLAHAKKRLAAAKASTYVTAISFANSNMVNQLRKYVGETAEAVPYRPDMFDSGINIDCAAYRALMLDQLKELCSG